MPKQITIPPILFEQIEARAAARGTTVDTEAAELLTRGLADDAAEAELLNEIRADREEMARNGVFLTEEQITAAKNWGRS